MSRIAKKALFLPLLLTAITALASHAFAQSELEAPVEDNRVLMDEEIEGQAPPPPPSETKSAVLAKRSPECGSCRTRKENLCAKECAATPWEHQRHCRLSCINEYCAHKCSDALEVDGKLTCEECLAEETPICAVQCTKGTPAVVAECKAECGKMRCQKTCS